jgi:hypothetical protein
MVKGVLLCLCGSYYIRECHESQFFRISSRSLLGAIATIRVEFLINSFVLA